MSKTVNLSTYYYNKNDIDSKLAEYYKKTDIDTKLSNKSKVSFTQTKTSGIEIGTINIDGTDTKIYQQDNNTTYTAESTASNIKMNGTQSAGSSTTYARGDHVHPTDTSRAASNHTHGNLQNDGKVGTNNNASKNVVTDSNGKITTEDKPTIPTASSTASDIKVNGTQSAGTSSNFAKADHVHPTDTSRAASNHVHGNINNNGTITNAAYKNVVTDADGKITTEAKPTIPTKTSDLTNDSGFITSVSGKADKTGGVAQVTDANSNNYTNIGSMSSGATQQTINDNINTKFGNAIYKSTTNGYIKNDGTVGTPTDTKYTAESTATNIKMNGTQSAGSLSTYARGDHVHPTDSSRAPTAHAVSATTYGLSTSGVYGHTKIIENLTTNAGNGLALGAGQGKALKAMIDDISSGSIADSSIANSKLADQTNTVTEYIVGTQTASTSAWTGKATKISSLAAGQVIYYKLPYASTSTAVTLNLTLADGTTTTGAKEVWFWNGSRVTTNYGVNSVIGLIYNGSQWWVINPSNNNNNNYLNSADYITTGEALTAHNLIACKKADKKYYKINTLKSTVIDISRPILISNGAINANTNTNNAAIYNPWINPTNLNGGTTLTLSSTVYQPVYLEGTGYSNGEFTVSTTPITQTLTNGRFYIMLGVAYATNGMGIDLTNQQVLYCYNGALMPSSSWTSLVNKPSTFTPSSHNHGSLANGGTLNSDITSVNKVAVTDSSNNLKTINGLPDTSISFNNNKALANSISPVDLAMYNEFNANRLAYIPGTNITIEYSTNGGSTYTTMNVSEADKSKICTDYYSVTSGNNDKTNIPNNRLRITIFAGGEYNVKNSDVYISAKKLLLYLSCSAGSKVTVEKGGYASPVNWTEIGTYDIGGMSGWNSIPFNMGFGGYANQLNSSSKIGYIRLTFFTTNTSNNVSVGKIRLFGETAWATPSTLATTGKMYTYDMDKNVTFPAKIIKNGGTSSQFLKADGSVDSNTYVTTSDSRLTNTRTPTDGTVTNAKVASNAAIDFSKLNITKDNITGLGIPASDTNTTYSAEKGITLSSGKFGHSNTAITAGTNQSSNQTPAFNATFNIPKLTYDAYGHITASASSTVKIPALPTASTSAAGITQLSDSTSTTSSTVAATSTAVKAAYDKGNHSHPYISTTAGSVGASNLASNAVETAKIKDANVTVDKFNVQYYGGRNLLPDTQQFGSLGTNTNNASVQTSEYYQNCRVRQVDASTTSANYYDIGWTTVPAIGTYTHGDYYTFSFWAKGSGTLICYFYGPTNHIKAKPIRCNNNGTKGTSYNDGSCTFTLSNDWKRYYVTWQLNPTNDSSNLASIQKYVWMRTMKGANGYYAGPMFEKGEIPHEWSPNPDDKANSSHTHNYIPSNADGTTTGNLTATTSGKGIITANQFKVNGKTSGNNIGVMKSDGTVDTSTYVKTSSTSGYIKNDGTIGTPTNTTYSGATGTSALGLVKISDSYTSSAGNASQSVAASSKAVNDVYTTFSGTGTTKNAHTHASSDVTGLTASKNVVTGSDGKLTTENKPTIPTGSSTATDIKMNGTQSAGSSSNFAKADHVHPVDTSRVAVAQGSGNANKTLSTDGSGNVTVENKNNHTHTSAHITGLSSGKNVVTSSSGHLTTENKLTIGTGSTNAAAGDHKHSFWGIFDEDVYYGTVYINTDIRMIEYHVEWSGSLTANVGTTIYEEAIPENIRPKHEVYSGTYNPGIAMILQPSGDVRVRSTGTGTANIGGTFIYHY